jgi:hypothetical protein
VSHGAEPAEATPPSPGRPPVEGPGHGRVIVQAETDVSGPLPSAAELRALREVVPDGPERVFALAERSAEHLRNVQEIAIRAGAEELRLSRLASMVVLQPTSARGLW